MCKPIKFRIKPKGTSLYISNFHTQCYICAHYYYKIKIPLIAKMCRNLTREPLRHIFEYMCGSKIEIYRKKVKTIQIAVSLGYHNQNICPNTSTHSYEGNQKYKEHQIFQELNQSKSHLAFQP